MKFKVKIDDYNNKATYYEQVEANYYEIEPNTRNLSFFIGSDMVATYSNGFWSAVYRDTSDE